MQPAAPQPVQLSELVGTLRRHWRILAVGAVAGLVLGALAWVLLPTTYTATTSVRVSSVDVTPFSGNGSATDALDVATDARLVTSGDVLAAAADELGTTRGEVRDGVSVENPPDTAVLDIAYTASSPEAAAEGSRAVAESFLGVRGRAAADEVQTLQEATWDRVAMLERSAQRYPDGSPARTSILTQAEALGNRAAELATVDTTPGQILGATATPSGPSSLGLLPLGVAGLALGLLLAVPVALTRREAAPSGIGDVRGLGSLSDAAVLDGTRDARPQDTWDIAALMLKLPAELPADTGYTLVVDGSVGTEPGAALVDALRRRGRAVRLVDAAGVNEGKIARGWPTARKQSTWGGEIVVIDSTGLSSDALKVTLASRGDQIVLARSVDDDALAARRLRGLLRAQGVDVALTVLMPERRDVEAPRR